MQKLATQIYLGFYFKLFHFETYFLSYYINNKILHNNQYQKLLNWKKVLMSERLQLNLLLYKSKVIVKILL